MKALCVLYGGSLAPEAFDSLDGSTAFALALAGAARFPGVEKTVLLGREGVDYPGVSGEVIRAGEWTRRRLIEELVRLSPGYDLVYYAWADTPFLDPELAGALADRHLRYAAEYSYADGWPYGFAPELLAPQTAGVLFYILDHGAGAPGTEPVERDALFQIIQKDINAFDIETEISPEDLRLHRLTLAADSRRNLALLRRFRAAGLRGAADAAGLIRERPGLLRTLPAFYPLQVVGGCPQTCAFCPWPVWGGGREAVLARRDVMDAHRVEELLAGIAAFSGDGVIDLSLWGEFSLHPERRAVIRAILANPALALVIETSGVGWREAELEELAAEAAAAPRRRTPSFAAPLPPLSWIVSLDAASPGRYQELRGAGFAEAVGCAKRLLTLFPGNAYVQATRVRGAEDDIEVFFKTWKDFYTAPAGGGGAAHVIIQKYDDFCGVLERRQASDLSPVKRRSCWHLLRDMPVLLDGRVPLCRETSGGPHLFTLGNVFGEDGAAAGESTETIAQRLETIWGRGEALYLEHCSQVSSPSTDGDGDEEPGVCARCDEYYTYNF